jgi:hypothetical protein
MPPTLGVLPLHEIIAEEANCEYGANTSVENTGVTIGGVSGLHSVSIAILPRAMIACSRIWSYPNSVMALLFAR